MQDLEFRSNQRRVVLVVDDEALVRMLAIDLFEEMGFEVLGADGGLQALSVLEARPDIAMLFTDCRMPGMGGPELAAEAARRWPCLRIVLVTGYANLTRPEWPVVQKPFDANSLERAVTAYG